MDGNDVLAVHDAAREAVDRARAGGGPSVIEAVTFRMDGHAQHDDAAYVPPELLEKWKQRDPIELYERWLVAGAEVCEAGVSGAGVSEAGISGAGITEKELRAIEAGIGAQLDEDQAWAEDAPSPTPESGLSGVYAGDGPWL